MLGDDAPPQRQQDLDQCGCTRGRLQVADVGLDRPDQQGLVKIPPGAVGVPGGFGLDRIPDRCAGSVGFHVVDVRRLDSCPGQGVGYDPLLGLTARDREPLARAVLVQCRSPDHSPDPVAVGLRVGQPLQHQDPAALAPDVAVGGGVEGLAAPVGRQHPGVAPQLEQPPRQDDVHAAGQGKIRLASLQPGHRLVHRCQ